MRNQSRQIARPMHQTGNSRQVLLLCALLTALTLVTFWPVLHHDFVNYDDPDYVTENEWVKGGLTRDGFKWAFTTGHASNWHPVTWVSHMLDVSLFGMKPIGHHGTNLLFHVANSVLLLLLLHGMTGALWRSAFVASLFALHPLHVESVAWVAERKDVLSAFFGLLCLMAYARYASGVRCGMSEAARISPRVWYAATFLLLALGLMSKPMLVTWPLVMLLLDFWPLQRIPISTLGADRLTLKLLVVEKIPFLFLAAASCWVTLAVQQDAMSTTAGLPAGERLTNAFVACVAYLRQTFWPTELSVFYPFVRPLAARQWLLAAMLLLITTIIVLRLARKQPFALAGWLWYLVTLLPVIGIIQVGAQARADRYSYLPLIGIFVVFTWAVAQLPLLQRRPRAAVTALAIVVVMSLTLVTRRQLRHWQNSESLFAHAAKVTQRNFIAWAGLGIVEYRAERYEPAAQNLTQALEYAPPGKPADQIKFYLGATLQKQGKGREALPFLEEALMVGPLEPERNYRLGLSLLEVGRIVEAEAALNLACVDKPNNADYLLGMGALLAQQGRMAEAGQVFTNVAFSHPELWLAQNTLATFLIQQGQPADAEPFLSKAVTLAPEDANLRHAHARCLLALGKLELARSELEEAHRLKPQQPQFMFDLAEVLSAQGQVRQAVEAYTETIQSVSNHVPALNNLAWLLATSPDDSIRDGGRAAALAEKACELSEWKQAVIMGTLAAAYAEAGRFPEAVTMAGRARDKAHEDKQDEVAKRNEDLIKLYQSGKPFREK